GLHGMGGEIDNTLPIYAELLGEYGFAYATIDGVAHGSRSLGGQPQLEIFKLSDLRFARDAFRQTLSDLYRFRQSMTAGVVIDRVPIAQTGIRWTGGSYGGIFGVMMSAFDEELEAAHVEGCGGPWSTILADSNMYEVVKLVFAGHAELGKADHALVDRAAHRFLELGQWLFDAGDPVGLAHQLTSRAQRPRMLMQYWVGEPVMPNSASVRLERAIGLPQNQAAHDSAGVWGVWGYDLEAWGVKPGNDDAHQSYWKIPEARAQAIQFLVSHGTEIHEPGG
ncbi:MAG TPA: hypothetical protein VFB62_17555, partial [Polyangiaceae bacterium]|nr:hypothetical protein [Polyangiaceae bacterium]